MTQQSPLPAHASLSTLQNPSEALPLTLQQEWWLTHELRTLLAGQPQAPFHSVLALDVHGQIDPRIFDQAFYETVNRHHAFRTSYHLIPGVSLEDMGQRLSAFQGMGIAEGLFCQVVGPPVSGFLKRFQLSAVEDLTPEEVFQRFVQGFAWTPFNYSEAPLIRACLVRSPSRPLSLIVVAHHSVMDRVSEGVLQRELEGAYQAAAAGKSNPSAAPATHLSDLASWERAQLDTAGFRLSTAYWAQRLQDLANGRVQHAELFSSEPPPPSPAQLDRGVFQVELSPMVTEATQACCKHLRTTSYAIWLSALFILLHRRSGRKSVAVGANFANRRPATANSIGWFGHDHLVGVEFRVNESVREVVAGVHRMLMDGMAHQAVPLFWSVLHHAVEMPATDMGVLFDYATAPRSQTLFRRISMAHRPNWVRNLHLMLDCNAGDGRLTVMYPSQRVAQQEVRQFVQELFQIVEAMPAHLDLSLLGSGQSPLVRSYFTESVL